MSTDATIIVILPALSKVEGTERSLPAVAGESKDLYLPRLPHNPSQARFSLCRVVNRTVLGSPEG